MHTDMNAPSRSPTASARSKRPQRPTTTLPTIQDTDKGTTHPPYLVQDNASRPFQLLEAHPLSLLCRFHNVKRVSLEEGVPPPFKIDVPILRDALSNPNLLLPTHMLAVYDQDMDLDPSPSSPPLPYTAAIPSGPPSFPATPLMIPVNADLWALYFSSTLSSSHAPVPAPPTPPLIPTINVPRRHSSTSSIASMSSYRSDSPSPSPSRPRAILSLPVHVMRVPSAKSLPLLLLAVLKVLPENNVAPALLPRRVLSEFPATPAILTQQLLLWLYPPKKGRQSSTYSETSGGQRSTREQSSRSPGSSRTRSPLTPNSHPLPPSSPLLSPTPSSNVSDSRRFSSTSASSLGSTSSYFSSSSHLSPTFSPITPSEPICALADPATMLDPDLRLLTLVQQNFGMWANALALGAKEASVVRLVELAWSVSAEARRLRFGDPLEGGSGYNDSLRRSRRSRSRTPLPAIRTPSVPSAARRMDDFGPQDA